MFKELLDAVKVLVNQAHGPRILRCTSEPDHVYWVVLQDGTASRIEVTLPRKHKALDLSAIVRFVHDCFDGKELCPEVWYSRGDVVAVLDGQTRHDEVRLRLEYSPQIKTLLALKSDGYPQKDFAKLLRVALHEAVPDTVIEACRYLKFKVLSGTEGMVAHGKQSIGKALEAELTGAERIPDQLRLEVPIFDGFWSERSYSVRVAVDIDVQAERFYLTPFPGEIEAAIRAAEREIGATLTAQIQAGLPDDHKLAVPVLYGQP